MPANELENLMTEIVVIGGGPAGLSAALVCARRGLDTTVIEKRSFPVIKTCGEGLMPGGVDSLKRLVPQKLINKIEYHPFCLLYTSPSPRDQRGSRMPSSA